MLLKLDETNTCKLYSILVNRYIIVRYFRNLIFFLSVGGGNWFTENLFWWSKRHDSNVFFVKYEDMQKVQY